MDTTADIDVAKVYDQPVKEDRLRLLVDPIWPRGISKRRLAFDHWIPEVAPSDTLRKWFAHDPAKWESFRARYHDELDGNPDATVFTTNSGPPPEK